MARRARMIERAKLPFSGGAGRSGQWRAPRHHGSRSFANHDRPWLLRRDQQVPASVALISETWGPLPDVPSRRLMAARRAAQLNPVVLKVEDFVVTSEAAHDLAQEPQQPGAHTIRLSLVAIGVDALRYCESLGIVRHHGPLRRLLFKGSVR
jgi:hypothetical protein